MKQVLIRYYLLIIIFICIVLVPNTQEVFGKIKHNTTIKINVLSNNFSPEDTLTISRRKFKKLFYEGTSLYFDNHYEAALPLFLELLKYSPDNSHINFYVGACYMNMPEASQTAIPYLQKAVKNTTIWYEYDFESTAAPVFAYFYLASVQRNNFKFNDAINNDRVFKSYIAPDNTELISQVDREIKDIETGSGIYVEQPEYTKYFNSLFVSRIQYDTYIRNPDQDINWWVNNLEGIKRETLINSMIDLAYSGKTRVFDQNNRILTNEQVKSIGNEPTLLRTKAPNPPYNDTVILIENQLNRQLITKIRFLEEWYLDDQTMQIGKKVVGITPLMEEYFDDNSFKGFNPLFTIYFDQKYPYVLLKDKNDTLAIKNLYKDSLSVDSLAINVLDTNISPINTTLANDYSTTIKAQTILTERIRYDVSLKSFKNEGETDWWVDNVADAKKEDFLKKLFDQVSTGLIQAYDMFDDSLSLKKIRELTGVKSDTALAKSPYPPYRDTLIVTTTSNFNMEKVTKLQFLEEWYLNEKTGEIAKRIVGVAPRVEIYDQNNTLKGFSTLFWVYFDKKYPIKISQKINNLNFNK